MLTDVNLLQIQHSSMSELKITLLFIDANIVILIVIVLGVNGPFLTHVVLNPCNIQKEVCG